MARAAAVYQAHWARSMVTSYMAAANWRGCKKTLSRRRRCKTRSLVKRCVQALRRPQPFACQQARSGLVWAVVSPTWLGVRKRVFRAIDFNRFQGSEPSPCESNRNESIFECCWLDVRDKLRQAARRRRHGHGHSGIEGEEAQRETILRDGSGGCARSNDSDKARHEAEQALEDAADRGIIDQVPKDVLPMVAEMLLGEYGYGRELAREGWSPLHVAVARDRIDVARALVERGASLSARTSDGETPLRLAITTSAKLVKLFLEHGAPVDEVCGGETLLHDACTYDAGIGAVRVLVAHGAEIDSPGSNGRTPLSRGCEQLPASSRF